MKNKTSGWIATAGIATALWAAGTGVQAATIFTQPRTPDRDLYASQNDTVGGFGNYATAYDNFAIPAGGLVTSVTWVGGYFNPEIQSAISQWTVSIWDDNGGLPGSLLQSTVIPGTANEASIGDVGGFPEYNYLAVLGSPFAAAPGTEYWLSVVPNVAFPPQWGWQKGSGGDSFSVQNFQGDAVQNPVDLAFSLIAEVPESSHFAAGSALLAGAIGCAIRRRLAR